MRLLLHVEENLERQVGANTDKNGRSKTEIFVELFPFVHHKAWHEEKNEASSNEVKEEVWTQQT